MRGYRRVREMRVVGRLEKETFKGGMGRKTLESRGRESSKTWRHENIEKPVTL